MSYTETMIETESIDAASSAPRPIRTIDEMIRNYGIECPDVPLVGYPVEGLLDFEETTAQTLDRYVDAAVQKLLSYGIKPVVRTLLL